MSLTKQFNGLGGTIASRESLIELQTKAKAENNQEVYNRISKLLETYPKGEEFQLEIDTPIRERRGLGRSDLPISIVKKGEELHYIQDKIKVASINKHGVITWHKKGIPTNERNKIRKAAKVVGLGCPDPEEVNGMLHGIEQETENHEEIYGLGKAVSANDIFDMVNNLMLNTIKEVGHLPWQKEWHGSGNENVMNYVTKKPYTGVNALLLNFDIKIENKKMILVPAEFEQPYYLTFAQIEAAGAKLKKGSKGREVIYYNFVLNYKDGETTFSGTDKKKFGEFATKNNLTAEQIEKNLKRVPLLKYYHVYKADDCEGLKPHPKAAAKKVNPIEAAQNIIDNYPNKPKYVFGSDKAFYAPGPDTVSMPKINAFSSEADYYSTFFHEITHSTGAEKRLNRDFSGHFGDMMYAFEELIAELGAVYLCAESGILFHTRENSAKYLRGWNKTLVKNMTDDNRFFMKAAAQAQKAANYILDTENKKEAPKSKVQKKTKENTETVKKIPKTTKKIPKTTKKVPKPVEKPTAKPVAKVQKKTKETIIGYAIVDNIDGSIVASKKTLPELEAVYQELDIFIEDLPVLVYEIVTKNDKNVLGKKADVDWKKTKVDKNGQTALFGALNAPAVEEIETIYNEVEPQLQPQITPQRDTVIPPLEIEEPEEEKVNLPLNRNSLAYRRQNRSNTTHEYYQIDNPDVADFLGKIEKKKKESVAITIAGGQGSGKTSFVFQLINEFAKHYKVGHASIEEHPESALYENKAERFWNNNAKATVDSPEINSMQDIHDLILRNDVIVIDSFSKLLSMDRKITLDDTFRKKYDGKLFIIIYQLTSNNSMRGGSASQFDGDVILFVEKFPDFNENYVYADKNRYQDRSLDELHYNIASAKLLEPESEEETFEFSEEIERI